MEAKVTATEAKQKVMSTEAKQKVTATEAKQKVASTEARQKVMSTEAKQKVMSTEMKQSDSSSIGADILKEIAMVERILRSQEDSMNHLAFSLGNGHVKWKLYPRYSLTSVLPL